MDVSVEDREAIRDLISLYSHTLDAGDRDVWIELFTEDGSLVTPVGNAKGRGDLLRWVDDRVTGRDPDVQVRHYVLNTVFSAESADRVRARSLLLYTRENVHQPLSAQLPTTGVYEDELRRTPAGWRFVSREMATALPLDPRYATANR